MDIGMPLQGDRSTPDNYARSAVAAHRVERDRKAVRHLAGL
jgi:hypothetical protein